MAAAPAMVEGDEQAANAMAAKIAAEAVPNPGGRSISNEAKARIDAALARRDRIGRAARVVLVEPFLHLGRQDPEHVRRL